jgi:hypothetical protein
MDVGCSRAWAGAPHGAIPNGWFEVLIGRRACSQRPRLSKARLGPVERELFNRDERLRRTTISNARIHSLACFRAA